MKEPAISIIVCTHNRAGHLEKCIDALFTQSVDDAVYEVLVVDNGSTDETQNICDRYTSRKNFRYIFEPILGLSQARNCGCLNAKANYVGYIDDDAIAAHHWIEKGIESFTVSPEPDWVGGSVTLQWETPPPSWLTETYYGALGWVNWGDSPKFIDPDTEWLVGCNSFFRKQALIDVGGFDVRLGRKKNNLLSGEEVQIHHRLRALGGKFYYHPLVHVYHFASSRRITPEYYYRRYYWGGITDYVMSKTLEDMPSQNTTEENSDSRLYRLVSHTLKSTGIFVSKDEAIKSRIYMSYVFGQVVAILKYSWRKLQTV